MVVSSRQYLPLAVIEKPLTHLIFPDFRKSITMSGDLVPNGDEYPNLECSQWCGRSKLSLFGSQPMGYSAEKIPPFFSSFSTE